jgi:hypothetical protein
MLLIFMSVALATTDPRDLPLSSLPIILGSHHSAALSPRHRLLCPVFHCFARCQVLPIASQLDVGIRYLDIRLTPTIREGTEEIVFCVSHHFTCDTTLEDVLDDVERFLAVHATEFVILYIRIDYSYLQTGEPVPWDELAHRFKLFKIRAEPQKPLANMLLSELSGKVAICTEKVLVHEGEQLTWSHGSSFYLTDLWRPELTAEARQDKVERHLANCRKGQHRDNKITAIALDAYRNPAAERDMLIELVKADKPPKLGLVVMDMVTGEVTSELLANYVQ